MGKKKRKYDKGASVGFLMALPTVLGLILLNIYPLCRTVYMSFFKSGAFGKWTFVGLDNYVTMFQSAGFWTVTKNTLLFMLLTVPVTVILGLLIAVLLNQSINGKTVFRAIYFLPMVVAPAAVAIHIMRGIPRQAVTQNVKIKGTEYTARQVAHPASICCWNTDMYGLDCTKPGAQEYYDSLLELYASWGVDFIKVDDICVKYGRTGDESTLAYGGDEIEMLRRAIDRCGRPIVLSLSPGPAMLDKAGHLRENANMWRITNDLWDSWDNIMEMFSRCNEWSPYVSEGCFPDCDMLPLGHISIIGCEHGVGDRMCRLSQDEQKTMMSLWCIFRSPLMLGAEMTDLDSWTLSLLTNEEVLKMHKDSRDAHQIERSFDLITWGAHDEEGSYYIALFNVTNWDETFSFDFRKAGLEGYYEVRDLWEREDLGSVDKIVTKVKSHGVKLYKLSKKQV